MYALRPMQEHLLPANSYPLSFFQQVDYVHCSYLIHSKFYSSPLNNSKLPEQKMKLTIYKTPWLEYIYYIPKLENHYFQCVCAYTSESSNPGWNSYTTLFMEKDKTDLTHELDASTRLHSETFTYSYSGENKSARFLKKFEIWGNHLFGDFLSYHFSLLVLARGNKFSAQTQNDTTLLKAFHYPK